MDATTEAAINRAIQEALSRRTDGPPVSPTVPVVVPHENTKTDIASYLSSGLMQVITLVALAYLGAKAPTPPVVPVPNPVVDAERVKLISDVADLQARVK